MSDLSERELIMLKSRIERLMDSDQFLVYSGDNLEETCNARLLVAVRHKDGKTAILLEVNTGENDG